MSTGYGENGSSGTGYTPANRVNFGWLSEAWQMFRENPPIWISATLFAVYLPVIFDAIIIGIWSFSAKAAGLHWNAAYAIRQMPHGLFVGVVLLNLIFGVFMLSGICRTAVKQVTGQPYSIRDLFRGGRIFGSMFLFAVLYYVLISIGSALLLLPGLLLAGLLLPSFAMIADDQPIQSVLPTCVKAMWRDRFAAAGLTFVCGTLVGLSNLVFGLGPLITIPVYILVSALAYRDMIQRPAVAQLETLDSIIPASETTLAVADGPRVSLTGEPIEEENDAYSPPK